ncbi:tRNA-splicing endonuclease subunit [Thecaphora frezii]
MSTLLALRAQYPERIPVHLHDGRAFVWHPNDVKRLRRDHAICGLMTGTLPLIPQQNVFLGLPLQLCNEEVVFLLRKGVTMLILDQPSHRRATKEELESYWQQYRDDATTQRRETKRARDETRKLFEAKLNPSSAATQPEDQEKGGNDDEKDEDEEEDEAELEKIPYHHTTLGSSQDLPWFAPSLEEPTTAFLTLSEARRSGAFSYPMTEMEMATCCVFETLHEQGFYLGIGLRFGGQFTVYPGDPLRYHAHYSAAVFPRPTHTISALELVASGRLGTAVKKSHLICSVDSPLNGEQQVEEQIKAAAYDRCQDKWGSVQFYSLSWAGFGT